MKASKFIFFKSH